MLKKREGHQRLKKRGADEQENVVETIIYPLKRLSMAAHIHVNDNYQVTAVIISYVRSVIKGLAAALSAQLGVKWVPGQL